jgi:crotonobetainyl-CoA:carnitine CoA-transferase CaiB-like acyl-CoA transferase
MTTRRALSGTRVLDLSWVMAGPMIGRLLADHGATVVKVESNRRRDLARSLAPFAGDVRGPDTSAFYEDCNAGKLGVALDLTTSEGRDVLRDLVAWTDILIESFTPGTLDRWGLGHAQLAEEHPRLIVLSTSILGASGLSGPVAGFGSAVSAISGIHHLTGCEEDDPLGFAGPYGDSVAPRFGALAVLAALDFRRRAGTGVHIDLSQVEASLQLLGPFVVDHTGWGASHERRGNTDDEFAPQGVYPCLDPRDGTSRWIAISIQTDDQWIRFTEVLRDPSLATEYPTFASRRAGVSRLDDIVRAWSASRIAADAERELHAHGIPASRVVTDLELAADPDLAAGSHFVALPGRGEPRFVESTRIRLRGTPAAIHGNAPQIGEHTTTVLRDFLGYDARTLTRLQDAGALG